MTRVIPDVLRRYLQIRAVVSAAGEVSGERAERLARIEAILGESAPAPGPGA